MKTILIILSIILFILFPLNATFTTLNMWIYILWIYLWFFLLWIYPIRYYFKKWLSKKYYIITLMISILILTILLYFWQLYWLEKSKKSVEKAREAHRILQEYQKLENNEKIKEEN